MLLLWLDGNRWACGPPALDLTQCPMGCLRMEQVMPYDDQYVEGFAEGVPAGDAQADHGQARVRQEAAARLASQQCRIAADQAALGVRTSRSSSRCGGEAVLLH